MKTKKVSVVFGSIMALCVGVFGAVTACRGGAGIRYGSEGLELDLYWVPETQAYEASLDGPPTADAVLVGTVLVEESTD